MNTTDKELTYTVTEEEYQKGLAKGWTDDDMLKPGKYKVRRSRFVVKPREAKVKVSLYIDGDILEYFRNRAAPPHAAPYQTQINNDVSFSVIHIIFRVFRNRLQSSDDNQIAVFRKFFQRNKAPFSKTIIRKS
jgi:uncharacterized protein (DUF4415 family)